MDLPEVVDEKTHEFVNLIALKRTMGNNAGTRTYVGSSLEVKPDFEGMILVKTDIHVEGGDRVEQEIYWRR